MNEKGFQFEESIFVKENVLQFRDLLDSISILSNKQIWVEKSPNNLYYIDTIKKYIPQAKFLHILRSGEDVIESIYDACKKYPAPAYWGRTYRNLDMMISRWVKAIDVTKRYINIQSHKIVSYTRLVEKTDEVVRDIDSFMGCESVKDLIAPQSR